MRDGIRLYFRYISLSLRSQLQYPASFIMMAVGNLVINGVEFVGIWALFARFGSLKDWKLPEVALFYGMVHMAFAISEAAARGFDILHRYVRTGDFDRILLRPRSTVLQVMGLEFQVMRVGRLGQGLLVLIWGLANLEHRLTLPQGILMGAAILGGSLLFSGLFVLQATLSFWTVDSLEVVNLATYGGVDTAQVPISIYHGWFRSFFIWIVPLATINYFPLMAILDHEDPLHVPMWLSCLSPLAGLLFFLGCVQVWKFGVRHYHSTGS
ncbi:MAG: ABC transporter permease [Firmicutes bacterium]|nr:ABC transporter permease [Bacillota bacterium]